MNIQREGAVPAEYVHADNDWDADNQGKGNVVEAKQQCAGRKKRPQAETLHDDPQAKCHYCTVNYYNCDVLKNKAYIAQADGSLFLVLPFPHQVRQKSIQKLRGESPSANADGIAGEDIRNQVAHGTSKRPRKAIQQAKHRGKCPGRADLREPV